MITIRDNLKKWSRLKKVHIYCDICKNNNKCNDWCFGEHFERSTSKVIKQSLITKIVNWIKGGTNIES